MRKRVQCFVDGFNLYHAIDNLGSDYLKWYDLKQLVSQFIDPNIHEIIDVFYFSAYANWLPEASNRHKEYVKAIRAHGCTPILGQFKEKDRSCRSCGSRWKAHEEKETDVNIALALVSGAFKDQYDEAFVVSRDSDLTPAVQMVREEFLLSLSNSLARLMRDTVNKWHG
ncbi:MAG: NYN domain-containing protein [Robiginitomaculum sp.]|nr:NYN domain-containing protein [Robiginitomaculum sp.]